MTRTFEDRLLTELKREVVLAAAERQEATARHRLLTPARAGFGLTAAAAAATAFVLLPGGGATAAYAVEPTGNGGVDVTIADWPEGEDGVRDFADQLEANGIATVYNPPEGYLCRPLEGSDGGAAPELPEAPDGAETFGFAGYAGGAEVIGPVFARNHQGEGPGEGDGAEGGTHSRSESGDDDGEGSNQTGPEDFVYHLHEGDTVILSEDSGQGSITFIDGACLPVDAA
ncbi:hypothetical protein [Streptomyces hoynatensis]|uniref:Uncharacterized protein n=1 Tax=Streptomyces hoynatensis TaxID=1141874 RepID=A0A3A9YWH1_9ACTN|nr:hypothetical protein [Streptomyces hoynatensis]RKN40383.1 hypothetical protein D7294_18180 [Streptomyces hoynatensis]